MAVEAAAAVGPGWVIARGRPPRLVGALPVVDQRRGALDRPVVDQDGGAVVGRELRDRARELEGARGVGAGALDRDTGGLVGRVLVLPQAPHFG